MKTFALRHRKYNFLVKISPGFRFILTPRHPVSRAKNPIQKTYFWSEKSLSMFLQGAL